MQVNFKNLVDDGQCYQTVRELRWPDGAACPSCESKQVIKRGFDDTEPTRACQWAGNWEPVRTAPWARRQPSALPCGR